MSTSKCQGKWPDQPLDQARHLCFVCTNLLRKMPWNSNPLSSLIDLCRDLPDESQTGINVRVFPILLQDRREVMTATSTSGNPNPYGLSEFAIRETSVGATGDPSRFKIADMPLIASPFDRPLRHVRHGSDNLVSIDQRVEDITRNCVTNSVAPPGQFSPIQ